MSAETDRQQWTRRIDELDDARRRGALDDEAWFTGMAAVYESAYLEGRDPRAQSGLGGDEARWEAGRRPSRPAGVARVRRCPAGRGLRRGGHTWTPTRTRRHREGPRRDPAFTNVAAGNVSTASRGTSQPTRCSTTTSGRRKEPAGGDPGRVGGREEVGV